MPVIGGKTIGDLPAGGSLTGTSLIEVQNDDGESVKISLSELAVYVKAAESIVPANLPYRGARVRNSADIAPTSVFFYTMPWDTEDRDTDGFWSLAAPTRLIVPAGVTKVRLSAYVRSATGPYGRYIFIKKNGNYFIGGAGIGSSNVSYDANLSTDIVDVTTGDYFELEVYGSTSPVTGGDGIPTGLATWFALEVVEGS